MFSSRGRNLILMICGWVLGNFFESLSYLALIREFQWDIYPKYIIATKPNRFNGRLGFFWFLENSQV